MATSSMVEGNMGKFESQNSSLHPEESSYLNTCVLLRHESIVETPNLSLSLSWLRDEQRVSLGELLTVDKCQF
jgi:hypothetical protein